MYTDLTGEFLKNGHEVYVAAPDNNITKVCSEAGIKVLRIKTLPLFNTSVIIKGIANLLLPYQYNRAIIRYFKNICFDLIVTPTPPITFIETAGFLKKKYDAKIYLILRDIFPQNAKDLGLIKNPLVFWYFRRKEKKLYKTADAIGCMSQKNIDYVTVNNPEVNIEKLHLLPNWTTITETNGIETGNKNAYDFNNKFVAIFGGNFGIPQRIDFLIEVAEKLRERQEILFLLVGEGTEKSRISKMVLDRHLENIRILDQMPRNGYLALLKKCDVGLVNLSDKFTIPNIPSRTLSYWSVKLPVLAAVDKNTDYGDLLKKCNGGLCSVMGDTDAYITNLLSLLNDPENRKQMGVNGYNYLVSELNAENAYRTILSRV
jgi:glycosyltransferase involved in cell wall biosynthesis